jgi:choline dehydrogenase-like flavoprotein
MLKSLETHQPSVPLEADVAIVGAGLAGLVLAVSLSRLGVSVALVESGPAQQDDSVHPLNHVEQAAQEYRGATEGRFRGLGGTSTRWGGALLPYLASDLDPHPCGWSDRWGLDIDELDAVLPRIEEDFGVLAGTYEGGSDLRFLSSFRPRLPKWPHFKNRSSANIYRKQIDSDPLISTWVEATVTELRLSEERVSGILARAPGGNRLEVKAKHIAIAAGAIETTRLLLLFDREHQGRLFPPDSPLGKGFHDHLSAVVARLEVKEREALARMFGFRFVSGGMRNLRFELDHGARVAAKLPAAFLHVAFSYEADSSFDGLRRIFQAAQKGGLPKFTDVQAILRDLPWFARAGWWRFVEKRILPPSGSHFELHLVTEQRPSAENTISLSDKEQDLFGLPLARVDWSVHSEDIANFHAIGALAIDEWRNSDLAQLARPIPRTQADITQELSRCGGIYHPGGTTRIGPSASEGVVDEHLRVHGVPGLWAIATSVFPAIGGTSPSLGLMQFAARAAQQMANEIRLGI